VTRPVALCYGTRPQVIKASILRRRLADVAPVVALDTGQHYDYALNALLYEQLDVDSPDHCLEVGSGSHAQQTAAILIRAEEFFARERPSAVVVIGDTNSTLGCALAAGKHRIPVVHVEAGLRARDPLMAEEINRRVVDSFAQLLCTPSALATARMRSERPDAIVEQTGDVAHDVLLARLDSLPPLTAVPPLPAVPLTRGPFVFATLHRAELTDTPQRLWGVLESLAGLELPVVLALHPRTRAALKAAGRRSEGWNHLSIVPAVGYLESLALTRGARAVVTDSGGVQREAYWLGVPCVTVRAETEWTETVEAGANTLVAPDDAPARLGPAIAAAAGHRNGWRPDAYGRGDAAERVASAVARLIRGTA